MRRNTPPKSLKDQHKILAKWSASGLSAAAFCRQHELNYPAFCKWRAAAKNPSPSQSTQPHFIPLAQLAPENPPHGWHIVLQLAPGVELRLSQTP